MWRVCDHLGGAKSQSDHMLCARCSRHLLKCFGSDPLNSVLNQPIDIAMVSGTMTQVSLNGKRIFASLFAIYHTALL